MELLELIKEALDKVKATDVKVYDLRGISPLADFTVVATVSVASINNTFFFFRNKPDRNFCCEAGVCGTFSPGIPVHWPVRSPHWDLLSEPKARAFHPVPA